MRLAAVAGLAVATDVLAVAEGPAKAQARRVIADPPTLLGPWWGALLPELRARCVLTAVWLAHVNVWLQVRYFQYSIVMWA